MILIGVGANLPGTAGESPLGTCRKAVDALARIDGLRLIGVSGWYESAPVPPSNQPTYVNGVVAMEGEIAPEVLLAALHAIEARHGRTRLVRNAARTLDLDVIAMGELVRDTPDPVLPHPRAHERAFVLVPLRDLVPGWRHPRLGRTVEELLAALPPAGVRPCAAAG
jgi:2-amino-4-hydroxy-6-hydroxymethyldihydropteridine diphosphokinase